jgi:Ca2+-binding RTX toxin-like protein
MTKIINLTEISSGGLQVTDAHFGLNFVSDYEKIGTKGWEQFDNIVNRIDIDSLRYPGGSTAETLFDYRNPDKVTAVNGAGETVKMETLDEYIDFCNREGINPTIIVPTRCLLTTSAVDGQRGFDTVQSGDLQHFFESILAKVDPNLQVSFEIGNEYETYMTSTEYGRVANAVVEIIGDAYSNFESNESNSNSCLEPDIFVQVWGYSVGGGTTYNELLSRNQQVLSQFSDDNLLDVDGLVSHYYFQEGRNSGTDQAQTLLGIDDQIAMISQMHDLWQIACNKDLISRISEWNILFRSTTNLGLQQINPMMEMFTSFVRNGFDALDFWSAQYQATSLADSSGRPMAAGVLMDVLKPAVVGTDVGATLRDDEITAYTFIGSGRFVAVLSSTTEDVLELGISNSLFPPGYRLVDAYSLGVDETTSDGKYRTLVDLPSYGEPDAKIVLAQLSTELISGATAVHNLYAFESLVLVFTLDIPGRPFVYGTDSSDLFYGTITPTVYVGGSGSDSISYVASTEGVNLDLSLASTDPSNTGDVLISIEIVLGSSFNDTITGSGEGNVVDGRIGDDLIFGGDGADSVYGGANNDTVFGGNGSDIVDGGDGDDFLSPGGGNDSVYGGAGSDVLSFIDYDDGVTVWGDSGKVETDRGIVTFRSIETFVGSNFNDRFSLGLLDSTVSGLGGDDIFDVLVGGRHNIDGGDGNDSVTIYRGSVAVRAGSGNDRVVCFTSGLNVDGGGGDDWIMSSGNGNTFEGGEGDDLIIALGRFDHFVFSDSSGRDVVRGFNSEEDTLSFSSDQSVAPWLVSTDVGTILFFDADTSVLLKDCFVDSVSDLQLFFV